MNLHYDTNAIMKDPFFQSYVAEDKYLAVTVEEHNKLSGCFCLIFVVKSMKPLHNKHVQRTSAHTAIQHCLHVWV